MASALPMTRVSHSKPVSLKQSYTDRFTSTGATSMSDPYGAAESFKRMRLNPKLYTLDVVEQPRSVGLRFVGSDENPSPRSYIVGEKSTGDKETHPGLLLTNYKGPVTLVWYLVADSVMQPHPYILEGEDCKGGVCSKTIHAEGQIIRFPGLYVRHVSRRNVKKTLEKRLDTLRQNLPGREFKVKDTMEYNLSAVRICFQAVFMDLEGAREMSKAVITRSLHCKERLLQREPRILSISQCKGSVRGREELSLQAINLLTDDVMVYFHFESLMPRTSWQAFADVISVSRKNPKPVRIVINTPPYHDQSITEPQTVAVQIRLIDNSISNTVKYTYTPTPKGAVGLEQRVKQKETIYVRHFTSLDAVAPLDPVLQNGHAEDSEKSPQETKRLPMYVFKYKERDDERVKVLKPVKVNASSQTYERHFRSGDDLEGYDSEKELETAWNGVDYDRVYWYRTLMMGSKSPSDFGRREEEKEDAGGTGPHPQRGRGMTPYSFSPRGILGGSSADQLPDWSSIGSSHSNSHVALSSLFKTNESLSSRETSESTRNTGEVYSSKKTFDEDLVCAVNEDIQQERDGGTSNRPETVDTSGSSATNHSTKESTFGCNLPEFTGQEVNLEPDGATEYPDLSKSNLSPAKLLHNNQLVAIKKIARHHYQEEAYFLWYTRKHERLIPLLGVLKDEASVSLILKYPDKGCLKDILPTGDSCYPPVETQMKWILQAAEGLGHLHQSCLAHQEFGEENCLISKDDDLMLSIPSNLNLDSSHLEGNAVEPQSVSLDKFGKLKADDVYLFGSVMLEMLSRLIGSAQTPLILDTNLLLFECQHKDECQRPSIKDVLSRLHNMRQIWPETFVDFRELTEPKTPDSGIFHSPIPPQDCKTTLHLHVPTLHLHVPTLHGQKYSVDSRESALSDGSKSSWSSSSTEQAESNAGYSSNSRGSRGSSETQGADDSEKDNKKKADEKSTTDERDHPGGQDGSQNQNRNQNEDLGSHLRPPRVTKRVDHTGGVLTLLNGEISLTIPPGALRDGQVEDITLTIDWNNGHIPPLKATDMNVAPIVRCSPTGLKFARPVVLQIPHCAVISGPKQCKMTVHCSQTEEGEKPQWERLAKPESSELRAECGDRCFLLHITHFTCFTISLEGGEESLAKEIMLVAYSYEVKTTEEDQEVRIYLYDDHGSNREKIYQEEKTLCGKMVFAPVCYQFLEVHRGNMMIGVEYQDPSWLLLSALEKKILFRKLWNLRSCDQCKFIWKNLASATRFLCRIKAQQTSNEEELLLEISNHVKLLAHASRPRQVESASYHLETSQYQVDEAGLTAVITEMQYKQYESSDSCQGSSSLGTALPLQPGGMMPWAGYTRGPPPLISYGLQQKICQELDPIHALDNDWRLLASRLGFDGNIKCLESKQRLNPSFSPTAEILQLIVQTQKVTSLAGLREHFTAMGRMDVASLIDNHNNSLGTNGEPLSIEPAAESMDITQSPDLVAAPLTAEQMPFRERQDQCPESSRRHQVRETLDFQDVPNRNLSSVPSVEGFDSTPAEFAGSQKEELASDVDHHQSHLPNAPVVPENPHKTPGSHLPLMQLSCKAPGSETDENENVNGIRREINRALMF